MRSVSCKKHPATAHLVYQPLVDPVRSEIQYLVFILTWVTRQELLQFGLRSSKVFLV